MTVACRPRPLCLAPLVRAARAYLADPALPKMLVSQRSRRGRGRTSAEAGGELLPTDERLRHRMCLHRTHTGGSSRPNQWPPLASASSPRLCRPGAVAETDSATPASMPAAPLRGPGRVLLRRLPGTLPAPLTLFCCCHPPPPLREVPRLAPRPAGRRRRRRCRPPQHVGPRLAGGDLPAEGCGNIARRARRVRARARRRSRPMIAYPFARAPRRDPFPPELPRRDVGAGVRGRDLRRHRALRDLRAL